MIKPSAIDNKRFSLSRHPTLASPHRRFDVIIVGAGPAGLLLCSLLANDLEVLLIERQPLGLTEKFWVTTGRRLQRHNLSECAVFNTDSTIVGTFLGSEALAKGDFVVVDEQGLLRILVDRCSRAILQDNTELLSLNWTGDLISAVTSSGTYQTRILVDATGGFSPIARSFKLHRLDGFFSVYGGHLSSIDLLTSDIVLGYALQLGYPIPMLEVVPTGPSSAFCVLIVAAKRLVQPGSLRESFEQHLRHNPFFAMTRLSKITEGKMGAKPIGKVSRRRLSGVLSFGESGLVQPPFLGTAFNEVLEYADAVAASIRSGLKRSLQTPRDLNIEYPRHKRWNDWLQLMIARGLLEGEISGLDRLVAQLARLKPEIVFKLYSNELRLRDIPDLTPFIRAYLRLQ